MTDNRRPMTVYIPAELHMALKMRAVHERTSLWELVTELTRSGLASRAVDDPVTLPSDTCEQEYA